MQTWDEILRLVPGYDPFATADDCVFVPAAAQLAVDFFAECLKHMEGAMSGKPFMLEPWQQAIVGNLFGWKRPDGTRRYREAFIFIPRKNGKTPLAAGICNYVLFCDREPGAQIYSAAADKDQAALLYRQAKGMIEQEPELANRARVYKALKSISLLEDEGSVYKVLSADADTKHGGNSHLVIVDELHAQPNRDLVDVLQTSMASANRKQPMMIHITTSDFHRPSICNEKHDYASKVRDGVIKDYAFLPVIYEAGPKDDWKDPKVWAKANPNLGVSVSLDYLNRECKRAQDTPSYENTFKRLHLNIRTEQDVRWIQLDAWDRCKGTKTIEKWAEDLRGQPCFAGLDLSSTTDLSAFVLYFPENKVCLCWCWIPEDNAERRERRDRVPYLTWQREGLIETTPGNVIDYEFLRARINALSREYDIKEIAFDPWNARQLAGQLKDQDGMNLKEFRQGFQSMNEPCKHLEKMIVGGELIHAGHEVLRWNASNATVKTDPAGNIKLDKAKSTERIDLMVALVMAIGISEAGVVAVPSITIIGG